MATMKAIPQGGFLAGVALYAGGDPTIVLGDADQLTQLLLNIAINGIQTMSGGGDGELPLSIRPERQGSRVHPCPPGRKGERVNEEKSLAEVHSSVTIPEKRGFLRRLFAFAGPAYLVAVGYMDPGNWATDIAAGSRYR